MIIRNVANFLRRSKVTSYVFHIHRLSVLHPGPHSVTFTLLFLGAVLTSKGVISTVPNQNLITVMDDWLSTNNHFYYSRCRSVCPSVSRSVPVSFFGFTGRFCVTAPTLPHATSVAVNPVLFSTTPHNYNNPILSYFSPSSFLLSPTFLCRLMGRD